jgi:hypothetical protein
MSDISSVEFGTLPVPSDKDLLAMNHLMADTAYQIKAPFSFMRPDKTDKISSEFILYILNDYLGHLQSCVASTKKMLPPATDANEFLTNLSADNALAGNFISVVYSIDIKKLSTQLTLLQKNAHDVTVSQMIPFTQTLLKPLIQVYYLGIAGVSKLYKFLYQYISRDLKSGQSQELMTITTAAIEEWYFVFNRIYPGLYPLVLRMCSPSMMTMSQLYYANGSRVLAWLKLRPAEILIIKEGEEEKIFVPRTEAAPEPPIPETGVKKELSPEVKKGLQNLEKLFPEAGWDDLENMPDMCPYFQSILQLQDAFIQLSPENPMQLTLVLYGILEELFQGLRLIKFEALPSLSTFEDLEDINIILEQWILYQETIFDKTFSTDLKAYTHQIYTQPDYNKTPYGRKLLSNMYSLTKQWYLPWFDIRLYGIVRSQKDEKLPPFYARVARLKRLLTRYNDAIESAPAGSEANPDVSVPGVMDPWEPYKFDVSNPVSRRLDALCGGKHSKYKTNALLIRYTLSILNVLDWWINDKESFAYRSTPDYLYRVVEPGSATPAFGINIRTDVDELFVNHLKAGPVNL